MFGLTALYCICFKINIIRMKILSCPHRPDITKTSVQPMRSSTGGDNLSLAGSDLYQPTRKEKPVGSDLYQPINRVKPAGGDMFRPMRELDDLVSQVKSSYYPSFNVCVLLSPYLYLLGCTRQESNL